MSGFFDDLDPGVVRLIDFAAVSVVKCVGRAKGFILPNILALLKKEDLLLVAKVLVAFPLFVDHPSAARLDSSSSALPSRDAPCLTVPLMLSLMLLARPFLLSLIRLTQLFLHQH